MNARFAFWSGLMFCCLAGSALAEVNETSSKVHWSYVGSTGPQHWGMLSPAFELCDTGKAQSPINIERKKTRAPYTLNMNYSHQAQSIINTSHTLQLNFQGNKVKEKEVLTYAGNDYELMQFHFHSPSQTLWHKQAFPLEIDFVHQGKDGKLLELAVLVKGGSENPALAEIIKHLPKEEGSEFSVQDANIEPIQLLPADKRYYAYDGSLTTPPCTEGVQWIVLSQPITASPAQILTIRQAVHGSNARPVQPLNGRVLSYAVEK
jgi:carbonic anhydrase